MNLLTVPAFERAQGPLDHDLPPRNREDCLFPIFIVVAIDFITILLYSNIADMVGELFDIFNVVHHSLNFLDIVLATLHFLESSSRRV